MVITSDTQVSEIAVNRPSAISVLEQLGIDYCCGGKRSLGEACSRKSLDVSTVLSKLAETEPDGSGMEWQSVGFSKLTEHIVGTHHAFTREQLVLLGQLAAKVERRHGDHHPEILEVNKAIAALTAETAHHFYCEENILFPYLRELESGEKANQPPVFRSVDQPVSRMMMEHDHTGDELKRLRVLTNNYQPPEDACTTFRALYSGLEELEADMHRHIHLENNILFPRALAAAKGQQ